MAPRRRVQTLTLEHTRKVQGILQMRETRQMQMNEDARTRKWTDKIATPDRSCNLSATTMISTTLIQRLCGSLCPWKDGAPKPNSRWRLNQRVSPWDRRSWRRVFMRQKVCLNETSLLGRVTLSYLCCPSLPRVQFMGPHTFYVWASLPRVLFMGPHTFKLATLHKNTYNTREYVLSPWHKAYTRIHVVANWHKNTYNTQEYVLSYIRHTQEYVLLLIDTRMRTIHKNTYCHTLATIQFLCMPQQYVTYLAYTPQTEEIGL